MENQDAKKALGSKQMIKKEAETSRLKRNRQQRETNKQEIILTESELDEIGSDYKEFLRTYDPEKPYSEYLAEAHQAMLDYLSGANTAEAEPKKDEPEAAEVESK
ncbi:hypothetical protein QL285_021626 [Trifolium repens]|nr:hypothetical protein QL285_021626 [Trifolium repens]